MQTITPALEAHLKSKLQVGTSGFRARFEIDGVTNVPYPDIILVDGPLWYYRFEESSGTFVDSSGHDVVATNTGSPDYGVASAIAGGDSAVGITSGDMITLSFTTTAHVASTIEGWFRTTSTGAILIEQNRYGSGVGMALQLQIGSTGGFGGGAGQYSAFFNETSTWIGKHTTGTYNDGEWHHVAATWQGEVGVSITPSQITIYVDGVSVATADDTYANPGPHVAPVSGNGNQQLFNSTYTNPSTEAIEADEMAYYDIAINAEQVLLRYTVGSGGEGGGTDITTTTLQPKSIGIDKSLRMIADQAEVEFANEDIPLGWGDTSIMVTNSRCRVYQWYGVEANAVLTFTGLLDRHRDHRDVLTTSVSLRDMMAILIDQTFSATAPQETGETGAVRTAANGVYLSMEVSDIVEDILDRAGWPTADREVTGTSYVLDEFIVSDGSTWADAIIGDSQLTGLVGYSAWADEIGVFHFAPTLVSQNLTDPTPAVYTYESGVDVVSLDDETDQYDLRTRVKVRGPLTTTVLQDTWREVWRTGKFNRPVGLWHDPTDAANLRVLDRGSKRLYKLRQSDRVVLSSLSVVSICPHPLGLSGDPADSAVYWILNAPWIDGGSGGNKVKKVRKSDNVVLQTFSLPSGNISAIKVSAAYLYFTNLSTDRFVRVNKTTGNVGTSYSHTYNAVVQANPSGMMINGTTLYLFWANGGSTARFLVCDESAPGTVTGVVKTAGTALHGGEFDTVTDIDCYGDSDSLGLVAKFTLAEAVDQTDEVFAEVVDTALEDELGLLAQLQDREHDTHPTDADHPYEVRRLTLDLSVITSLAQATETAQRQLDIASQRRRVLDVGIIGNPALQKTDPVAIVDPVTGIEDGFVIDTYRTSMTADGTYLGTLALFPVEAITDEPDDEGEAEDPNEPVPATAALVLATYEPTVTVAAGGGGGSPEGFLAMDGATTVSLTEDGATNVLEFD